MPSALPAPTAPPPLTLPTIRALCWPALLPNPPQSYPGKSARESGRSPQTNAEIEGSGKPLLCRREAPADFILILPPLFWSLKCYHLPVFRPHTKGKDSHKIFVCHANGGVTVATNKRVFTLRLSDEVFDKIGILATNEHRSITNYIEFVPSSIWRRSSESKARSHPEEKDTKP